MQIMIKSWASANCSTLGFQVKQFQHNIKLDLIPQDHVSAESFHIVYQHHPEQNKKS